MNIVIYHEGCTGQIGGAEYCDAVLASGLSKHGNVSVVHGNTRLDAKSVRDLFQIDIGSVRMERIIRPHGVIPTHWSESAFAKSSIYDADIFIWHGHHTPVYSPTKRSIAYVHFPLASILDEWPFNESNGLKSILRKGYYYRLWRKLLKSYGYIAANSHFTAEWIKRRWGVEPVVIYPPVDSNSNPIQSTCRTNRILSVGRFSVDKNHDLALHAFNKLRRGLRDQWEYFLVGTLDNQDYFNRLQNRASAIGATCIYNCTREHLKKLYSQSTFLWHMKGVYADPEKTPEECEHFGISIVEAMSFGCIPLAHKSGGPKEIIEHGVSGFLWSNLDELVEYTTVLANNSMLRVQISEAAKKKASTYSQEHFLQRIENLLRIRVLT